MTVFKPKGSNSHFQRGTGCFTCKSCKKQTRDTGENGGVGLCPLCDERSGLENSLSDNGWGTHGDLAHCKTVAEVHSEFNRLKAAAEAKSNEPAPAAAPAPTVTQPDSSTPATQPIIQRLETGYWLVRWNRNQFVQWPCDRAATAEDFFGWFDDAMIARANEMADAFAPAFVRSDRLRRADEHSDHNELDQCDGGEFSDSPRGRAALDRWASDFADRD